MFIIIVFFLNCAVCEIMWKHFTAEQASDDNKAYSHFITEDITNTHSEYVIIIAFPRKQWLLEGALIVTFICTLPVFNFLWRNSQTGA
jgi:hypothetical protein